FVRFTAPLLPLCLLSLLYIVRLKSDAMGHLMRLIVGVWAFGMASAVVYALVSTDYSPLREPADAAAAAIRADWEQRYHCGPAIVLCGPVAAHASGLYFGSSAVGLSVEDYQRARWIDRSRITDLGVVVVTNPAVPTYIPLEFDQAKASATTLHLPTRTFYGGEHVYEYR